MKKLPLSLLFLLFFTNHLYTQPAFTLDQYKAIYIKALNYEGTSYSQYYFGEDVFKLRQILGDKLASSGVPIVGRYSTGDCEVAICEIVHEMDQVITLFKDCNNDLFYSTTASFQMKPTTGVIEIGKIRPGIQAAYRRSLNFMDGYQYAYNATLETPRFVMEEIDFTRRDFKQYLKSDTEEIEGIYENLSLEFPECVIGIKKAGGQYKLFYLEVEESLGSPGLVVGRLQKADTGKYKGYWKVIGSEREIVQLELQKKKLRVEFTTLVEEIIVFKKKSS